MLLRCIQECPPACYKVGDIVDLISEKPKRLRVVSVMERQEETDNIWDSFSEYVFDREYFAPYNPNVLEE